MQRLHQIKVDFRWGPLCSATIKVKKKTKKKKTKKKKRNSSQNEKGNIIS